MLRGGIHHQQQQLLQKLLNDNGYSGDLPSTFYASIPPGSELMKWLVSTLDNSNFVQPADAALAAEYSQARQALEQDRSELMALTDQGLQQEGSAAQVEEWLSMQTYEEVEAQLQELQHEHALMKAQLQEMQALERSLDTVQQAQRAQQQRADAASMRDAKILSTEAASLAQLNDQLNAQLASLSSILKEMQQLITVHGRRWLMLSGNMESYMDEDKRFVDTIVQYTATSVESKPHSNGAMSKSNAALNGDSSALDEAAMKELKRLRMAFYLSEMEYVQAKAKLAGAQAMASEMDSMAAQMGTRQTGSNTPWLDDEARGQLATRVRLLELDQDRIMQQEVPMVVTELAQLQDTYVFQGEGALKEAQLQRRIALVHQVIEALVGQGARHLVLDSLWQQEHRKLQAVLGIIKDVGTHVDNLSSCAEARGQNYQRAAAYVTAAGLASSGRSHSLCSSMPTNPTSLTSLSLPPSQGPSTPIRSPASHVGRASSSGQGAKQQGGLRQHLSALQLVLEEGEVRAGGGNRGVAGVQGSPLPAPHALQISLLPQQQLCDAAQQCAHALRQLQAQMEAVVGEVEACSSRNLPEQVEAATAEARRARSLVFSSTTPPSSSSQPTSPRHASMRSHEGGKPLAENETKKPVLSSPELTSALQELSSLNDALQAATNEVVLGYQEHTARLEKHKADAALERSVLKMFYLDPQKLEETVTELQSRLDAATAATT